MQFCHGSRRTIRYSIFIGVLAGSIFSGSGAFAAEFALLDLRAAVLGGNVQLAAGDTYLAGDPADNQFLGGGSTYFGNFTGTFEGNGATITGLVVPLFDFISGSVSNLNLETHTDGVSGNGVLANSTNLNTTIDEVHVTGVVNGGGTDYVGGVVGYAASGGTISNSTFSGEVVSITDKAGGLVGESNGLITGSSTSGSIGSTSRWVGGLVGNSTGQVTNSSSSMTVSGDQDYVGGLIGATTANVLNSFASGDVASDPPGAGSGIGGLIGYANGAIEPVRVTASYASGSVDGYLIAGGLIGITEGTVIIGESYATGSTEAHVGNYAGGLIGYAGLHSGITDISDSYATGFTTGASNYVGGLVGYSEGTMSILHSYSTGNVAGVSYVGGLVGEMSGDITNSYATGIVNASGDYVGGLVGNANGNLTNSYVVINGNVTGGGGYVGGLAGNISQNITNSYANVSGDVIGDRSIGGLAGNVSQNITNSYAVIGGDVIGTNLWASQFAIMGGLVGGLAGSAGGVNNSYVVIGGSVTADFLNWNTNPVGGLVGQVNGEINNSYATVALDVSSSGGSVGGLVGYTPYSINNSVATIGRSISGGFNYLGGLVGYLDSNATISDSNSNVVGNIAGGINNYLGGLVGFAETTTTITNSNSNVSGNIDGTHYLGGLVGYGAHEITNSNALVSGNITGVNFVGGLIGNTNADISNSDSSVQGNLISTGYSAGGLAGYFSTRSISNSNSLISGSLLGNTQYGGLIGSFYGGNIINSFYMQDGVLGGITLNDLVGYHYNTNPYEINYTDPSLVWNISEVPQPPTKIQVINYATDPAVFAIDECLNGLNPYLLSLSGSYENSCSGGDDGTPTPIRRERIEREVREVAETRAPEKIEKSVGFKNETPLPKSAPISFIESTEKIELAKVKAVEIAPTANVKVVAKAGEALQISLKSESKEPVELWVKSPDGNWVLAGVITFDKDGKAILPPLQFKNAGDYSLVLSKPSAGSAKGSAPLNQTGSLLVAVS
jgi:hypothetical protein